MAKPGKVDPLDKHFRWMLNPPPHIVLYFAAEYIRLNAEDAKARKEKENK